MEFFITITAAILFFRFDTATAKTWLAITWLVILFFCFIRHPDD